MLRNFLIFIESALFTTGLWFGMETSLSYQSDLYIYLARASILISLAFILLGIAARLVRGASIRENVERITRLTGSCITISVITTCALIVTIFLNSVSMEAHHLRLVQGISLGLLLMLGVSIIRILLVAWTTFAIILFSSLITNKQ